VFTQGGARSSLTLGYNHVTPTEFQFGSLRSQISERGGSGPGLGLVSVLRTDTRTYQIEAESRRRLQQPVDNQDAV